jgi:hypothetical protein
MAPKKKPAAKKGVCCCPCAVLEYEGLAYIAFTLYNWLSHALCTRSALDITGLHVGMRYAAAACVGNLAADWCAQPRPPPRIIASLRCHMLTCTPLRALQKKDGAAPTADLEAASLEELNQKVVTLEREKNKEEDYRNYMQLERVRTRSHTLPLMSSG